MPQNYSLVKLGGGGETSGFLCSDYFCVAILCHEAIMLHRLGLEKIFFRSVFFYLIMRLPGCNSIQNQGLSMSALTQLFFFSPFTISIFSGLCEIVSP